MSLSFDLRVLPSYIVLLVGDLFYFRGDVQVLVFRWSFAIFGWKVHSAYSLYNLSFRAYIYL